MCECSPVDKSKTTVSVSTRRESRPHEITRLARQIVDAALDRDLVFKLAGGVACWEHCPLSRRIVKNADRIFNDVDYVAHFRDKDRVAELLTDFGFREDPRTATVPGLRRTLFVSSRFHWRVDVAYDVLEFSHVLDLRERLELDHPTIPLAELLLQKMQIVQLNPKDVADAQMLLLEHDIGHKDREVINAPHIARLCASDWGLWRTVTTNLAKLANLTACDKTLGRQDRSTIERRATRVLEYIMREPKGLRWKLRALVGERVRWHNQVEEL